MDFAIDLETLGRNAGCVILSIGAVAFERDGEDVEASFYRELQIDPQLKEGFKVEADTLRWWCSQDDVGVLTGNDADNTYMFEALMDLSEFVREHETEDSCVWCVGTDFDVSMLRWMCDHFDQSWPFGYRASRDVRTMCDVLEFDRDSFNVEGRPHHALDDAIYAALLVQAALRGKQ